MKNTILSFFAFLLAFSSNAQDISDYYNLDKAGAIALADTFLSVNRVKMKLGSEKEDKNYLKLYYIPVDTSAEDMKKIERTGVSISGVAHILVQFRVAVVGADIDMEIEGITEYSFLRTALKFIDAVKIWQTYFDKDATIENAKANGLDNLFSADDKLVAKFYNAKGPLARISVDTNR